ncbi:hypothetical protein UVI_02005640 [Ustilaginoidea virens]|uniref:Alpha/beta hydrolase fold-3 domain-containing protein n=1 Tax=Ustilaginoidea virens TaxID=1159556 RepID=A0A1B5KV27_USTVR|nr:hypothetical protein UVI_02005640 [Ustilaginoidea virens]
MDDKLSRSKHPATRQKLLRREIQSLGDTGGSLLWMGNRTRAHRIVLFLPGGGYTAPALRGHFEWRWNACVEAGQEAGVEGCTGLPSAAETLGGILDSGISPSNVYMGGDSARGNLSVQVLSHVLHPLDGIRRVDLPRPLAGVFLVSPWLSNNVFADSFQRNNGNGMVSLRGLDRLGASLYGRELITAHKADILSGDYSAANPYITPLDAEDSGRHRRCHVQRVPHRWEE